METNDLFAHGVQYEGLRIRPEFFELLTVIDSIHKSDGGHVAGKRVVPHVEDVFGITGPGNSPLNGFPADGDIFQPSFDEALDFVETKIRNQKLRILRIQIEQRPLKLR